VKEIGGAETLMGYRRRVGKGFIERIKDDWPTKLMFSVGWVHVGMFWVHFLLWHA